MIIANIWLSPNFIAMLKIVVIFSLFVFSINHVAAQNGTYSATIYRDAASSFFVVNEDQDSIFVSRDEPLNSDARKYRIVWGEGREKDELGIKEKNKSYLLNAQGDTLLTTMHRGSSLKLYDGSYLQKAYADEGWTFKNEVGEVVSTIDLMWNDAKWVFDITTELPEKQAEALNHYIFSYMAGWASSRSRCDDGGNDIFWDILFLVDILH